MIRTYREDEADRSLAGQLLSKKLEQLANSDAIVVGIPRGGVVVASAVAEALGLSLHVLPCRKLRHPGDNRKAIGAVSLDGVALNDDYHDIPGDYISHQVALLRSSLRNEITAYNEHLSPISFKYKTIIIVDDILISGTTVLACLRDLSKQLPLKLIVAVPFVSARAARLVGEVADEVVFIRMDREIVNANDYYRDLQEITVEDVTDILRRASHVTESI